jgi:NitT/TauT family transport system permease protein
MTAALHEAHFTRCGSMTIGEWLALIGTVLAEFFTDPGTALVLACRIIESSNRLNIPPISATPPSRSALGVTNFLGPSAAKTFLHRKWHESAVGRES